MQNSKTGGAGAKTNLAPPIVEVYAARSVAVPAPALRTHRRRPAINVFRKRNLTTHYNKE